MKVDNCKTGNPFLSRTSLCILIITVAVMFSTASHSEGFVWRKDGKPIENTDNQKSREGFGAMLLIIDDKQFFEDWKKPNPPHFKSITIAKRMVPIYVPVIFAGASRSEDGAANITYDVTILKPDNSVYGEQKGLVGIKGQSVGSSRDLQLAREYMAIRIEPKDPVGIYTIETVVKDNVKKIELRLKQQFTVEK